MNTDQIKALKERADKASALAELHANVLAAMNFQRLAELSLLGEGMQLAKAGILARIEAEIGELLKPQYRVAEFVDPLPTMCQPAIEDPNIGTLDSSDTWEQPVTLSRWATMEQT